MPFGRWRKKELTAGEFPKYLRPKPPAKRLVIRPVIRIEAVKPGEVKEQVKERIRRVVAELSEKESEGTISPRESLTLAHFRNLAKGVMWELRPKGEGREVVTGLDEPLFADAKEKETKEGPRQRERASKAYKQSKVGEEE